jgi:integrase
MTHKETEAPVSTSNPNSRRSYGTGHLYVHTGRSGREQWYGRWRAGGKLVNRAVGPCDQLTRVQAERKLQEMIGAAVPQAVPGGRGLSLAEAGRRYLEHAEMRGRKPSTLANVESELRVHLDPFFKGRSLQSIAPRDVDELVRTLAAKGLSPKSIRNVIATLSAICNFARAPIRGWIASNPCDGVELPAVPEHQEIRFLTLAEIDQLIAHARPGPFQELDRALYRTAAMTGLRRGELLALRWKDVDWLAQLIRVRRNYVRGRFGTPKSRRSSRSVPMANKVALALEQLSRTSRFTGDEDLVFAHPELGEPLYAPGLARRMRKALRAAGLDSDHRFHDLRHAFGTQCAAVGVPLRTLQEWMGHRDLATTQIYADYAPSSREADMIAAAFGTVGTSVGTISADLSASQITEPA